MAAETAEILNDTHRGSVVEQKRSRSTGSGSAPGKDRISIQLFRAANQCSEQRFQCLSHPLLVPSDLTVGQFIRGAKKRLKLGSDTSLSIFIEGVKPSASLSLKSLHQTHASSDGTLHITYKTGARKPKGPEESSPRGHSAIGPKSEAEANQISGGATTLSRLFGDGALSQVGDDGQRLDLDLGNAVELVQIRSEKEERAKQKFQKRMSRRAAGPRDRDEAPSNLELAQALTKLKLDTCLSGMIQAAINPSGSPNGPAPAPRPIPSICGGARIPAVCSSTPRS